MGRASFELKPLDTNDTSTTFISLEAKRFARKSPVTSGPRARYASLRLCTQKYASRSAKLFWTFTTPHFCIARTSSADCTRARKGEPSQRTNARSGPATIFQSPPPWYSSPSAAEPEGLGVRRDEGFARTRRTQRRTFLRKTTKETDGFGATRRDILYTYVCVVYVV